MSSLNFTQMSPSLPCQTDGTYALVDNKFVFSRLAGPQESLRVLPSSSRAFPHDLRSQQSELYWLEDQFLFLALVPAQYPFHVPMLRCLDHTVDTIPTEPNATKFRLSSDLRKEWHSLEKTLKLVAESMAKAIQIPFPFSLWRTPTSFGYKLACNTAEVAADMAIRSRDAFKPLLAFISMALLALQESGLCSWHTDVCREAEIHPQFIADIEALCLQSMSPRIGAIVDVTHCNLPSWVFNRLKNFDMPFILFWGDHTYRTVPTQWLTEAPPATIIAKFRLPSSFNIVHQSPTPTVKPTSATGSHDTTTSQYGVTAIQPHTSNFPPVEKNSGQHQGEPMCRFFARREEANRKALQTESNASRTTRLQREENAKKFKCPGIKAARVYTWEKSEEGYRIRTAAGRQNYASEWSCYGRNQKRYDSFRDEWDLCSEFDPNHVLEDVYDDDDEDEYWPYHTRPMLSRISPLLDQAGCSPLVPENSLSVDQNVSMSFAVPMGDDGAMQGPASSQNQSSRPAESPQDQDTPMSLVCDVVLQGNETNRDHPLQPADDQDVAMSSSFATDDDAMQGLASSQDPGQPGSLGVPEIGDGALQPPDTPKIDDDVPKISTLQSVDDGAPDTIPEVNVSVDDLAYIRFGFVGNTDKDGICSRGDPSWHDVCTFVGQTFARRGPVSDSTRVALRAFFGGFIHKERTISQCDLDMEDSDVFQQRRAFLIQRKFLNETDFYIISSEEKPLPYKLALTSAASIVELLRLRIGPDLDQVIKYLLTRGIPFRTLIQGPTVRPAPDNTHTGLGYRPIGYKPDHVDFVAYEALRNTFLATPRGRAALMAGGILGRLAREAAKENDVFVGPTDDVFVNGVCLSDMNTGTAYWDDGFTPVEIDLICGSYQIETGDSFCFFALVFRKKLINFAGQINKTSPTGLQLAEVSWWPKPAAWNRSGLNIGYWSSDCEEWYQNRLSEIRSQKADPRSHAKWKHALRLGRRSVRQVVDVNEQQAKNWLGI